MMEIVTSWMVTGRQQEAETIVFRVLNRRVGQLDSSLEERVRGLSYQKLEDLVEAGLDFSSQADLVAWLDRQ